jgi:DNA repair exonuclease SbcCD nuclease subunit
MKIKKAAMLTDIHFGRKNNNEDHNIDCINYLNWFSDQVRADPDIDAVFFLGDWHEQRSAINGLTLDYSTQGANILNNIGVKVWFLSGNHDLYYRNNRDVSSNVIFKNMDNFIVVNEPTTIEASSCVITPYLFDHEYDNFFDTYKNYNVIVGHFEFKGFVLTGETFINEHGPDSSKYGQHKRIFSGHFHKRQSKLNVHYIGNTFPMDFSDANDTERGMAIYDFRTDTLQYKDWGDCPKYIKTTLTDLLKSPKKLLHKNARVRVVVDDDISLTENTELKKLLSEKYNLREIVLEEQVDTTIDLTDIEQEVEDLKLEELSEIIPELLKRVRSDKIDSDHLVRIYKQL